MQPAGADSDVFSADISMLRMSVVIVKLLVLCLIGRSAYGIELYGALVLSGLDCLV